MLAFQPWIPAFAGMTEEHRTTQISRDEEAYRAAKEEAWDQGISLAEFLRRLVANAVRHRRTKQRPWMRHAGTVASGDADASQTVDAVVYGRPRP